MNLRLPLFAFTFVLSFAFGHHSRVPAKQPNILWLSAEDISPHFGCYGDPHAITPHIDQLASEGVRYSHAFTAAGVCAPCRSTIISGFYQNSIGTHHMRSNAVLPEWLKPFPMLMQKSGYFCTNNSKTDYQFKKPSKDTIWNECGGKAHWKHRADDQPFFAVYNFTGCHESGIAGADKYQSVTKDLPDSQRQDAAKLTTLPPYYPDTPIVREDWKRNYELITAMDAWAGDLIGQLKEAGVYEDTIVFFWSDHGVGLPRAKRWLYDSGTRIPLVIRIPAAYRVDDQGSPGSVESRLVDSTDFGPTVLNLAGVKFPKKMRSRVQGQPFLGDKLPAPRRYVYGARDRMDERYDIIRTVRDSRYRYVRNFEPLKPYYQYMNTPEKGATMREIRRLEKSGALPPAMKLFSAKAKPSEELYDTANDPHEINNLADAPEMADKLAEMQSALRDWQNKVGDVGLIPEAEIEIQEQTAGSRYAILNEGDDAEAKLRRLVDIATKASQGPSMLGELTSALGDSDPSVRYWAATGIGNIGAEATSATKQLTVALKDSSPNVRIAAARAIAKLGHRDQALTVLGVELTSEHQWGRLAAAIVLDEMESQAKPALADLMAAMVDQPNKYIVRVANRAINDLTGKTNVVP